MVIENKTGTVFVSEAEAVQSAPAPEVTVRSGAGGSANESAEVPNPANVDPLKQQDGSVLETGLEAAQNGCGGDEDSATAEFRINRVAVQGEESDWQTAQLMNTQPQMKQGTQHQTAALGVVAIVRRKLLGHLRLSMGVCRACVFLQRFHLREKPSPSLSASPFRSSGHLVQPYVVGSPDRNMTLRGIAQKFDMMGATSEASRWRRKADEADLAAAVLQATGGSVASK